jgi:hypothetical protein
MTPTTMNFSKRIPGISPIRCDPGRGPANQNGDMS